ncbi:MAG: (5-formylfuran-3-yl)methyl phosphate synthase [Planctomycetaceae bacterium]|nr:(5-formylfuran-3-yl)methyl phosphate synthase [Planctomycetaceae bacterium]
MTGLLVSVRSAAEAEIALAGGADLIDIKEPRRGSLGAADPAVWNEVRHVVAGRRPVSVALGELADLRTDNLALAAGLSFAKVGLAGCAQSGDWMARWTKAMAMLPAGVGPVLAAYADWQSARSPEPALLLPLASRLRSPLLLVDTFDKSAGGLLDHVGIDELAALSEQAARHQMRLVLAGSLDEAAIRRLAPLRPAYFAVRGAACGGQRTQAVQLDRVKRLVEVVQTSVCASAQEVA